MSETDELPEDWASQKFDELFEIISESYRPDRNNEEVLHYSMPAYDEGQPVREHTSDIGSTKREVPDRTILFPKLNIRKKRFWLVDRDSDVPKICSTEYWPLDTRQDNLLMEFFEQYFRTDKFVDSPLLSTSSSTNSHQRVKRNLVKLEKLPVPPIKEQRRIASVLYSVDEQLRTLTDRHDRLSELKNGLMQDLLTGNTRVTPDIPVIDSIEPDPSDIVDKEWAKLKLPKLFDKYQAGGTPKTTNEDYYVKENASEVDNYHFLKIDSITDNKYITEGSELITEEGLSESTARLYEEGDLVLSIYGSYGKVGVLSTEAAVSQAMLGIVPNGDEVNSEFLYYLLDSLGNQYEALASGTTQQNLSKSLISLIDVDVPPLWEQERIASILYTVDEMIARTSDLIDEYERLKRGLMQDLLSGDVRTSEDLEVLDEIKDS